MKISSGRVPAERILGNVISSPFAKVRDYTEFSLGRLESKRSVCRKNLQIFGNEALSHLF
ncbi:hypothetical protein RO21_09525 [[Actinobacillus] muris]|uniref:Uncharacterized protein n=1 Tax=Muribacter muris TaxID=67855 RepID=A0A0J5P3J2_9PAST|nr:hypothetical protein [Muribacter muris]KMK50816.1 hypothetical protein RO21_09525 [[Actinobacillus] muris] [Muribacter muris]MBF0785311.1 hypothetical protein [Muribacter muris]MBF0826325.1 hypothetical protein [Muribacter muris]TFV09711.1 hypothetical protein E4T80_07535 [Muribacter muris]